MKKLLLSCIAIVAIAITVKAQVAPGAVVTYRVTDLGGTSTYNWSITPASAGIIAGSGNVITVTWGDGIGANATPALSVYPRSTNNCNGATRTLNVTVGVLDYTVAINGPIATVCPYEATNMSGGGAPVVNLTITPTGAAPAVTSTWSITYRVAGGSWTTASSATATATANFALVAQLTAAGLVEIRDWTVGTTTYTPTSVVSASAPVYAMPSVSGITTP